MKITDNDINNIAWSLLEGKQEEKIPVLNQQMHKKQMQNEDINRQVAELTGLTSILPYEAKVKPLQESKAHFSAVGFEKENTLFKSLRESRLAIAKMAKSLQEKGLVEEFDKLSQVVSQLSSAMDQTKEDPSTRIPTQNPTKEDPAHQEPDNPKAPVGPTDPVPGSKEESAAESLKKISSRLTESCGSMNEWKKLHEDKAEETPRMLVSEAHVKMHRAAKLMDEAAEQMAGKKQPEDEASTLDVVAMEEVESALNHFGLAALLEGVASLLSEKAEASKDAEEKKLAQVESTLMQEIANSLEG